MANRINVAFMQVWRWRDILVVLLTLLAGCGPDRGVVPVTGVAKLEDGTPVARGTVFLTGHGVNGARGQIMPDGTFRLGTFTATDGAQPGVYKTHVVGVTDEDTRTYDEMLNKPAPPSLIHKKYNTAATSDLRVEIKAPKTHIELLLTPNNGVGKSSPKK